ncbi:MAG: pyridoxal phosphate-dependent aminotransferase [Burkholderiaceae bacterium]|jgi:aspartate/methionine/tyrosine aminotransferase|nr:pyridoxal phosphate-dependent aminotransferase [Burkholderiaceae bacterium]
MKISERARRVEPFYVMEMGKSASAIAREVAQTGGAPMIYLNMGEPDFTAPPLVCEAAARAIRDGKTQYTQSTGLDALRERISHWYATRFGVRVPARRIVITAGASAALQLACLVLLDAGDEVLMPDPCYPCNRQFVSSADARAVLIATTPEARFQLTPEQVQAAWGSRTRGVLLASPSNPTGTSIHPDALRRIHAFVRACGGVTLVDEIYLGLSHDATYGHSALALDEQIISINSFSKYFSMTGWRLGWLVVPDALVSVVEQLAQHLFICPSTVAQHAALACFEPESLAEYEKRRAQFKARRDWFVPQLERLGLRVPVMPDGAFYAWADCGAACQRLFANRSEYNRGSVGNTAGDHSAGSWQLALELMRRAHLAVTPGRDFGTAQTERYVRFSTASAMPQLQSAVARLAALLP